MTIKPHEVATIVVQGLRFDDWESVFVQDRWADPWPIFRFTASERDPIPRLWERLQFKPDDECAIYLGGRLAVAGVILKRQTAYDAQNHGVMLEGVGITWYAATGSVVHKTGNFDEKTFSQVAHEVIAPFGVGVKTIGALNATPFKRLQVEPGETLWNFLERIARPRGIVMGSDHQGNFLLIGDHAFAVTNSLIEGHNILRCQATISREAFYSDIIVRAATAGSDDKHGRDASEQEARIKGRAKRYRPLITPAEQPVWGLPEVVDRARNEAVWQQGDEVRVTITVQGWFAPNGNLWRPGELVAVYSPMAMINMGLKIQNVTFTQDSNSGTLTTLDLVAPWLLKDHGDYNVGKPGAPQAPGEARPDSTPPATPQSGRVRDPHPETLTSSA